MSGARLVDSGGLTLRSPDAGRPRGQTPGFARAPGPPRAGGPLPALTGGSAVSAGLTLGRTRKMRFLAALSDASERIHTTHTAHAHVPQVCPPRTRTSPGREQEAPPPAAPRTDPEHTTLRAGTRRRRPRGVLLSSLAQAPASRHLLLSVRGQPPSVHRAHCGGCGLRIPGLSDVSMATRALQELDGGLGSCQAGEDLSTLADPGPAPPPEDRVPAMPRLAEASSWPHDSQEPAAEGSPAGGVDARPKKTEKEPVTKVALGAGKERLKAGATPRSPARKKAQAAPPPPPPPIPAPGEELPWGDLSLNKCLVLASLLALLGSAFQLCRDAVSGEADASAPVPEPWAPPSSAPEPASPPPPPRPEAWVPPSGPPAPPVEAEKAAGERRAPEEAPRKEERRRKEKPPKEQRLPKERPRREERPRKQEKPRAAREPGGALPRRWAAREAGHRHRAQDSGDPGHRKRQAWGSPRRLDEDRPPGRRKQRAGKGRD
ncbi:junctional sarcoplasmic reticulum protein 1 [Crocuta crocuta]